MKKKILFELPLYLPHLGGIQISTHKIAKGLIKKGYDVSILCERSNESLKEFELMDGIKVYRYPKPNFSPAFKIFSYQIQQKNFKKFAEHFFPTKKFDIIFSRFFLFVEPTREVTPKTKLIYLQPSIIYIATKKMMKNTPKIYNKIVFYFKTKFGFHLEKKALNLSDVVLTRSSSMKEINKRFLGYAGKQKIFTQIVDTNKFKPVKKNKFLLKKLGLENKKIALCVCRMTSDKNVLTLIKMFEKLPKKYALILIGGGGDIDLLKKYVEQNKLNKKIVFLGERKDPENYYNLGDIFVLASEQEGFPNVFLEAMASGLPIIGFHSDPPKINMPTEDIVKKKACGFAVKDEKEMAEKIDLLLSDDKLRKKMGKAAVQESKKYSWEKTAKKIIELANQ